MREKDVIGEHAKTLPRIDPEIKGSHWVNDAGAICVSGFEPVQTCDHIIGLAQGKFRDSFIYASLRHTWPDHDIDDYFNYCPTCGARLETV